MPETASITTPGTSSTTPSGTSSTATSVPASGDLADVEFPVARGCPFSTPAEYEQIREHSPITKVRLTNGGDAWWIAGHELGRAVLADRRFSSDRRRDNFPFVSTDPETRKQLQDQPTSMLGMDGAEHAQARRALMGEFTVRRMAGLRPRIQQIVDQHIDEMLSSEQRSADLVEALSLPVPSLVICELLGVPYADHDFFQAHSGPLVRHNTPPEVRARIQRELNTYLGALIDRKVTDPTDDLLGRQIAKQRAAGTFDRTSLVSMAFLLLIAGHETTANMISLGVVGLLQNPDQLAMIKEDPEKTPPAVEELLRYFTIADTVTARVATEDVQLGGTTINAGDGVVISGLAADHDPTVFTDPDRIDLERGARHHVAFGFGPHQCIGQTLARMELQIVFDTLFRRIPTLRLAAPLDDIPFKSDAFVYGAEKLPVAW
ncbi:cytochrome P450 [Salinispora fenicalii]|uniref:cytochrome P450 n=1 Tax=Salinispora fenicalii TaxID=1137263 RepID=UPI0004859945|nr:cytochrome P450 [Salinispora fenicalii]